MKKALIIFLPAAMGLVLICFLRTGTQPKPATPVRSIVTEQAIARPPAPGPVVPTLEALPPPLAAAPTPEPPASQPSKLEEMPKSEQESLQYAIFSAMHAIEPLTETEAAMEQNKGVSHFATNPRQKFQARFLEEGGVRLSSSREGKTWQAELRLTGRTEIKTWQVQGTRAERQSRPGVTEWYENRRDGLEHGFTMAQRPDNAGRTSFSLDLDVTSLGVEEDRTRPGDLVFTDPEKNTPVLAYRDLKVQDATGRPLIASMSATGSGLRFTVQDAEAVYPVTIDPLIASLEAEFPLEAKVTAADGAAYDYFGSSVSLSGDIALIGAYGKNTPAGENDGAAYVFVRSGSVWTQQAKLTAADGAADDFFGSSVSLSSDTALIGAYGKNTPAGVRAGASYVFVRNGSVWTQQAKLTAADGAAYDLFGSRVALSGDTAIIGAFYKDTPAGVHAGASYVFVRNGSVWTQQAKLTAADGAANDEFGSHLALSGDTAIIGAYYKDTPAGENAGAAYVFVRSGSVWTQQAKLTASDGAADDEFGWSVALSGDIALIGAELSNGKAGAAYFFSVSRPAPFDHLGLSVDIEGDAAVVGALDHDAAGASSSGAAWVLKRNGTMWASESRLLNQWPAADDRFGVSVAINGDRIVVGADYDDSPTRLDTGSVTIFSRHADGRWLSGGPIFRKTILGLTLTDNGVGRSVAIEGDVVVSGATRINSGEGEVVIWKYAYTGVTDEWVQQAVLTSDAPQAGANFGFSVALSGDQLAVGEPGRDTALHSSYYPNAGRVLFFTLQQSGPDLIAIPNGLFSNNTANGGWGFSVAMEGNTAVAGGTSPGGWFSGSGTSAAGMARVYVRDGGVWNYLTTLDTTGLTAANYFGSSVSVSNGVIAVGAFGNGGTPGRVRLYRQSGSTWPFQNEYLAPGAELLTTNTFGIATALSGDTLLVGAYGVDDHAGSAYVYRIIDPDALVPVVNIAVVSGGNVVLTWPADTGKALWRSSSMSAGTWTKVTGSESMTTYSYPVTAAPQMFFRLGPP